MFFFGLIAFLPLTGIDPARAAIDGLTGTTFSFTAKSGYITTADGNSILMWGYANGAGVMQHPGPTLILNQGSTITLNLANQLTVPVSIVFPGQANVIASGGTQGVLTREAPPEGMFNTPSWLQSQGPILTTVAPIQTFRWRWGW